MNRAVLWRWSHRASGRIRGVGMYWLCHREVRKVAKVGSHATAMRSFPEAIIVSYVLILLRLWLLRRCFFIGILTGRKDYRIMNAVVVRVYRLVGILVIMGVRHEVAR